MKTFQEYEDWLQPLRQYPHELAIPYCTMKLAGEVGEVSEKVGKTYRDHDANFTDRAASILYELGDVLWYVTALANELGYSLEDVAAANVEKLNDRVARGTLKGEGDNR